MTQQEYIEILFHDLGFNQEQKRIYLESEYSVKHIDELNPRLKSHLITVLKEMK